MTFDFTQQPGKTLLNRNLVTDGEPLLSIITPFYNGGKYIEQTYNCVMNQTFPWFEWIIVDDGSTEKESLEILERLAKTDGRIRVFHKENGGISSARNYAIKKAKTEFILPLDCDDLDEPTFLEYCWWMLEKNPKATWAYSTSCGFEGQEYLWNNCFDPIVMKTQNILTPTALIKKSMLEKVGFYDDTISKHYNEDWHLWLRLIANDCFPVQATQEYLHWYRRTSAGVLSIVEKNPEYARLNKVAIEAATEKIINPKQPIIFPRESKKEWEHPVVSNWNKCIFKERKKTNVLLIAPWLEMGGADKFNLDLIKGLDKEKFDIGIITTAKAENVWLQEFRKYAADIFNLPNFMDRGDYAEFISYYIKSRNVDVVFLSNSYYGYYVLPWLRENFPEIAIVDYVHMEEWYWRNGGFARASGALGGVSERTYTCNSGTTNIMTEKFSRKKSDVETVFIGVDEKHFERSRIRAGLLYEELDIKEGRPVVLFACRLHPQKRPYLMLQIAKRVKEKIPNVAFVVAGDSPEFDDLKQKRESLGLEDTVCFAGAKKELRHFYRDAKATLICSIKEGLSLVAYESCSMGVPVVSADVGGQGDLIDSSVGALVKCRQDEKDIEKRRYDEEEISEYCDALVKILSLDDDAWQKMSNACRRRIEEKFTIGATVRYFEAEFQRLATDESLKAERRKKAAALQLVSPLAADCCMMQVQEQAAAEWSGKDAYEKNRFERTGGQGLNNAYVEVRLNGIEGRLNSHQECLNWYKERLDWHDQCYEDHCEVIDRHEEVVNRHEEVVNRHEQVVNDDWAWLKSLEARVAALEKGKKK